MNVKIFVPNVPEFESLLEAGRRVQGCVVERLDANYWSINAVREIRFERKALGIGPALWNSALTGGFVGSIKQYDRNVMKLVADD